VNAMLSYRYTLLVHEAVAALETAGLDPMLGYLHRHRWAVSRLPWLLDRPMIPGRPLREVCGQRVQPVQERPITAENASVLAKPVTAGQHLCHPLVGPVKMITASLPRRGARKPRHRRWSDAPNFRYCRYA